MQDDTEFGALIARARQAVAAEERERPTTRWRRAARMSDTWDDLDDLLRGHTHRGADEWAQVRWPYQVGLLAYGAFKDAISYGRSLGLTITLYPGGGLLVRRGHAVAEGPWGEMRRFLLRFQAHQEEWNHAR